MADNRLEMFRSVLKSNLPFVTRVPSCWICSDLNSEQDSKTWEVVRDGREQMIGQTTCNVSGSHIYFSGIALFVNDCIT